MGDEMNHFVYNALSALSLHINRDSFLVLKGFRNTELFSYVLAIFTHSTFKSLKKEDKKKIYSRINELKENNMSVEDKKKWLVTCLEQLGELQLNGEMKRTLRK